MANFEIGRRWVAWLVLVTSAACLDWATDPVPVPEPKVVRSARVVSARLAAVASRYPIAFAAKDDSAIEMTIASLDEVSEMTAALPAFDVEAQLGQLIAGIEKRDPPARVAKIADNLSRRVLDDHGVIAAPLGRPDKQRAEELFASNCVKCHGDRGGGDGPGAAELKSSPRSFLDESEMETMTARRVFSALTDGLVNKEMPQFDLLASGDRWSLAFYVLSLRSGDASSAETRTFEKSPLSLRELAGATDVELETQLGQQRVSNARTLWPFQTSSEPLGQARAALSLALADHRAGRRAEATARIDALLADAFSVYRPALATRAGPLMQKIEAQLYELRARIPAGASPSLEQSALRLADDLQEASRVAKTVSPIALAGAATIAILFWTFILIVLGAAGARHAGIAKGPRAVFLGAVVALLAGVATILLAGDGSLASAAGSRHQVAAALRVLAIGASLAILISFVRRLSGAVEKSEHQTFPWWLVALAFVCAYGGAVEWANALSHLRFETESAAWQFASVGIVVSVGIVMTLWLVERALAALNRGAAIAASTVAVFCCALALAGGALRSLIDGGSVAAASRGSLSVAAIGIFPFRWSLFAQCLVAALGILVVGWGLTTRRPRR